MPYEIVGDEFEGDDDLLGAIGADLDVILGADTDVILGADYGEFGADEDLLRALAVSGGAGGAEIVGASPRGMRRRARPASAAAKKSAIKKSIMNRIAQKGGAAVVQSQPNRRRRFPLGFTVTALDPTTSQLIPAAPQNMYRVERVVIPSDIAYDLGVVDIKVGNQSQLVQSVEVPAAAFTENAINTDVLFDTAEIGNQISILAHNKNTTDSVTFTGALFGTIAK